jgi:hypothetical protein
VKTTDSAPSTTTYTYDPGIDPRGMETSRTDSVAGTFSSTYNADGDLVTEALPGGYTLTIGRDETGTENSRTPVRLARCRTAIGRDGQRLHTHGRSRGCRALCVSAVPCV